MVTSVPFFPAASRPASPRPLLGGRQGGRGWPHGGMWVAGDPACCCRGLAEVAAAAVECRGRVRQAHTTTGLAGGFGGEGATSWVAGSSSRLWRCRRWVVLYANATQRRRICAPRWAVPCAGGSCGLHQRSQEASPCERPCKPARRSPWCPGPPRSPPQRTGAGRVRGWRLLARWSCRAWACSLMG